MRRESSCYLLLVLAVFLTSCGTKNEESVSDKDLAEEKFEAKVNALDAAREAGDADFETLVELGVLYQANARLDEAREVYESAIKRASSGEELSRLYYYLGAIDLDQGRIAEAEERFEASVAQFPEAMPALYKLAELNFKSGEAEVAIEWFSRMIAIDSRNAYALLGRARSYLSLGREKEALADLLRMREENPDFKGGLGLLAQLLEENGDEQKALVVRSEIVRGAVAPFPHAWLMALRKASYDKKELGIYYEEYANAEQAEIAVWFLNRMEELNPNDWNAKILKGLKFAKDGKTEQALAQYRNALNAGADKSLVYPLIVKCMLLLGKAKEAASFGEQGLADIPDSVDLLVELAGVYIVQFKFDRAAEYFERALALNPYHEKSLQFYASMLAKQGKATAAKELIERWIQVSPADPAPYLELASLHLKRGDSAGAIKEIESVSQFDWSDRSIERLRELANDLREKNRRRDALKCFEIINERRPSDQDALVARVELLVQLKQLANAMEVVGTLVRLQPENLAVRIAAGDIYGMNGEMEQAEREWRAALELAKGTGDAKAREEIISRLRSL